MAVESLSHSNLIARIDPSQSHFERLGLSKQFNLDRAELEQAYLRIAAQYHPDRFVNAIEGDKTRAIENSSLINQAYRVLRDAVSRAEYLVKLEGWDLDSNESVGGAPCPDATFLSEMIERREELPKDPRQREQAAEKIEAECERYFDEAVVLIGQEKYYDAACTLVKHRYLRRLYEELEAD